MITKINLKKKNTKIFFKYFKKEKNKNVNAVLN